MNQKKNAENTRRKVTSAVVAIAMVLTMLLSGTLAYFYSAKAVNTIKDSKKEVIGHDDLVKVSDSTYNKDVYAENTGNNRVFVRIRLSEDLSLDGAEVVPAAENVIHTIEHKTEGATASNVTKHIVKDDSGNYVEYDGEDPIHDNFEWTMGGEGKYFLSKTSGEYPQAGNNTQTYYMTADGVAHDDRGQTITAEEVQNAPEKYGKAPQCEVITMAEYKAKETGASGQDERISYKGWVIDADGWAYWSQPLQPGEATGLLLDQVKIKNLKEFGNRDYEYNINVEYQAVDDNDIGIWLGTKDTDSEDFDRSDVEHVTDDAQAMLQYMQSMQKVYPDESLQLMNEIYQGIAELPANYDVVKKLYDYALTFANKSDIDSEYGSGTKTAFERCQDAKQAAEELKALIDATPSLLTETRNLDSVKDGVVKNSVISTYGKDGVLTKA